MEDDQEPGLYYRIPGGLLDKDVIEIYVRFLGDSDISVRLLAEELSPELNRTLLFGFFLTSHGKWSVECMDNNNKKHEQSDNVRLPEVRIFRIRIIAYNATYELYVNDTKLLTQPHVIPLSAVSHLAIHGEAEFTSVEFKDLNSEAESAQSEDMASSRSHSSASESNDRLPELTSLPGFVRLSQSRRSYNRKPDDPVMVPLNSSIRRRESDRHAKNGAGEPGSCMQANAAGANYATKANTLAVLASNDKDNHRSSSRLLDNMPQKSQNQQSGVLPPLSSNTSMKNKNSLQVIPCLNGKYALSSAERSPGNEAIALKSVASLPTGGSDTNVRPPPRSHLNDSMPPAAAIADRENTDPASALNKVEPVSTAARRVSFDHNEPSAVRQNPKSATHLGGTVAVAGAAGGETHKKDGKDHGKGKKSKSEPLLNDSGNTKNRRKRNIVANAFRKMFHRKKKKSKGKSMASSNPAGTGAGGVTASAGAGLEYHMTELPDDSEYESDYSSSDSILSLDNVQVNNPALMASTLQGDEPALEENYSVASLATDNSTFYPRHIDIPSPPSPVQPSPRPVPSSPKPVPASGDHGSGRSCRMHRSSSESAGHSIKKETQIELQNSNVSLIPTPGKQDSQPATPTSSNQTQRSSSRKKAIRKLPPSHSSSSSSIHSSSFDGKTNAVITVGHIVEFDERVNSYSNWFIGRQSRDDTKAGDGHHGSHTSISSISSVDSDKLPPSLKKVKKPANGDSRGREAKQSPASQTIIDQQTKKDMPPSPKPIVFSSGNTKPPLSAARATWREHLGSDSSSDDD